MGHEVDGTKRLSSVGVGIEEKQLRDGLSSENKRPFIKIGYIQVAAHCATGRTAIPSLSLSLSSGLEPAVWSGYT